MKHVSALHAAALLLFVIVAPGCVADPGDTDTEIDPIGTVHSAVISAAPFQCPGNQVALRTINGYYVVAEGGGGGEVRADRLQIGAWERFTVHDLGGTIALQAHNGSFVVAEGGGGGAVNANRPWIGDWEKFRVERHWNGYSWALRAHSGHYVVAENGGGGDVNANRTWVGAWESFTATCL